ncbi:MAG TPA: threonine synthase, partial [Trueperaceae bacterium]|nr:threonine synthase [Trueperaceae bacterium]
MSVRYHSTRAAAAGEGVDFETALLRGLAPDGGLYLPRPVPPLPAGWEQARSMADLAVRVLPPFLGPAQGTVEPLLRAALDFPVPLRPLARDRFVLELFHGPTLAFKDVGARTMARLMADAAARRGGHVTVLVATSGDTGSAVADAFQGFEQVRVALLYPEGMVSEMQERQLTVARPGVQAYRVRGSFDDCQRLVKGAFADPALVGLGLSSANSINVGRLLPQALYYLWGALQLARSGADASAPVVAVPSGNLGNLTGGVLAARMGLATGRFLAAHNVNDYFPDYLEGRTGAYAFRPTRATLSNAMDVGAPSNFERLLALLGDALAERVWGVSVDDDATLARMALSAEEDGYLPCPHTAVALEGLERYRERTGDVRPAMLLATAHPAKFPDAVSRATGREAPTSPVLESLARAERNVLPLEADPAALREALLGFAA